MHSSAGHSSNSRSQGSKSHMHITTTIVTKVYEEKLCTGLPRSVKSQGKTKFFQGQGNVSEFSIWSGKFRISAQSQGNLYHFGYYKVFL